MMSGAKKKLANPLLDCTVLSLMFLCMYQCGMVVLEMILTRGRVVANNTTAIILSAESQQVRSMVNISLSSQELFLSFYHFFFSAQMAQLLDSFSFQTEPNIHRESYDVRELPHTSQCHALHHVFQQGLCPACFPLSLASALGTRWCMKAGSRSSNSSSADISLGEEGMPSPFRIFDCAGAECSEDAPGLNALHLMMVLREGVPALGQSPPVFGWGCQRGSIRSKDFSQVCGIDRIKREIFMHGPAILFVDLREERHLLMQFEEWGVWDDDTYNTIVSRHSLMLVGWSSTPTPHWIVKNSWGPTWGNKGFGRVPWKDRECVLAFEPLIISTT
jgi:hypothetical protein